MKLREIKKLITFRKKISAAIQTVDHSREIAKKRLPRSVWDFIDGGAGEEHAIKANRATLDDVIFQPKYLVDVSKPDTSLTIFGKPISNPLILSPSGLATLAHPEGKSPLLAQHIRQEQYFVLAQAREILSRRLLRSLKEDCGFSYIYGKTSRL